MLRAYDRFPALPVDTTNLTPEETIGSILGLTPQGTC